MCPRPRKASDDQVFAAAHRAMARLGPGELTLAEVAAEAGLTAGALVQRFGSKRDLVLAWSARASDAPEGYLTGLRAKHRSPLATLRAYAKGMAGLAPTPVALARNLAYLQIDLADADFRVHLAAQARATRVGIESLLREAVAAGELRSETEARALARVVETALSGSLLTWAFYQQGKAADWLLADLDAVLGPWLASPSSPRMRRQR
jgi:AcrR family transcriptional regulator